MALAMAMLAAGCTPPADQPPPGPATSIASATGASVGGSSGRGSSSSATGGGGAGGGPGERPCAPFPAMPDASCTGVPPGTRLTTHDGDLHVTSDGAVVDAMLIQGCVFIEANDVTIKRSKVVRGDSCEWSAAIEAGYGAYAGTLIEDVEVDGGAPDSPNVASIALIGVHNYTARRLHVHHGGRAFNIGDNVVIEDSYIHDMYGEGDSHNSGIGSNSGTNITLRHNTIHCDIEQPGNPSMGGGCSGSLVLYADDFGDQSGTIDDLLVEENLFNGGGYCLLIYNHRTDGSYIVRRNLFGSSFYPDCGQYGPNDLLVTTGANLTWEDNSWHAPGESHHGQSVSPQISVGSP
jgi:hypothetical protein